VDRVIGVVVGFVFLCLAGCGGSTEKVVKLVPVTGLVTLDGKPLPGAAVLFRPQAGTPGDGGFGTTDDEGRYSLQHRSQKPGIELGSYTVAFSKVTLQDGSPIPEGKTAADVEAVERIPRQYTPGFQATNPNPATAVIVGDGGGTFDFKLVSGRTR